MRDLDEVTREALRRRASAARFSSWGEGPSIRMRRPPRRGVRLAAIAAAVVATGGIVIAVATFMPLGRETPTPGGADTVVHTDEDDRLSISLPRTWTLREDPSGPDDPKTIFAAGSWPLPTTEGSCAPAAAARALPADGALMWLIEYRPSGDRIEFSPRPARFELEGSPQAFECSPAAPSQTLRFEDGGRRFQVHVAFGTDGRDREDEVLAALDSLQVERRGGRPELSRIESLETTEDGTLIRVSYTSGTSGCYAFDQVEVRYLPDEVLVGVYEQRFHNGPCFSVALSHTTTVELDEPLAGRPLRALGP